MPKHYLYIEDDPMNRDAMLALQDAGTAATVQGLSAYLAETPSPTLRTGIIKTLGIIGDPSAGAVIEPYLNDDDHHVREWSRHVLDRFAQASG